MVRSQEDEANPWFLELELGSVLRPMISRERKGVLQLVNQPLMTKKFR
jgi:hypothetical protein